MHMPHTGLDEELLASDEPMPFNDRPYFRRLLDFDDLVRAIAREVWAATANALREKTQLEIDYKKPTGQASRRLVEPLVLVHMNWDWLLAARDPEDGLTKTFYPVSYTHLR